MGRPQKLQVHWLGVAISQVAESGKATPSPLLHGGLRGCCQVFLIGTGQPLCLGWQGARGSPRPAPDSGRAWHGSAVTPQLTCDCAWPWAAMTGRGTRPASAAGWGRCHPTRSQRGPQFPSCQAEGERGPSLGVVIRLQRDFCVDAR